MALQPLRPRRRLAALAVAIAVAGTLAVTLSASAAPSTQRPVFEGARYLALGDSVPFGYRESNNLPTPDYTKPRTLVGFPEIVGRDLGLRVTNAACPGETTGSMIDVSRPTNGCERGPGNAGPGYRDAYPLHVRYHGSQLDFAVNWLKKHPNTRLVSLMIGANDGFLCQELTPDHCMNPKELNGVLTRVSKNVTRILSRLRNVAKYHGQLVIVNYYALDYANPTQKGLSLALDQVIDAAAQPFHVRIAPGFALFRKASRQAHRHPCAAGLLTILQGGSTPCGVHPSFAGQALLASAVERVTRKF